MRYVAAYMLAALAKKGSVNSSDICKILGSVGIEADNNRVDQVVNELSGRNLVDIITDGNKRLASVPSGAGVASSIAAPTGGSAGQDGTTAAPAEAKKEEKKEESEESEEDLGFSLFD